MDSRVKELSRRSEKLFEEKKPLDSLHQEIAENFYPERADFTIQRNVGAEFGTQLATSYPLLVRRDLGNNFSAMLRPTGKRWFGITSQHEGTLDLAAKRWLEDRTEVMRRAMYDTASGFTRATKEADQDFAAFGQAVMTVEPNRNLDGLSFRTWHLRDCAWSEDDEGHLGFTARKWKPKAGNLVRRFGDKVSAKVRELAIKDPNADIQCRHVVIPADEYGEKKYSRFNFVVVTFEVDGDDVLDEAPQFISPYVIPRWQTVSGSQYAYSPATVAGLPDARLLQSMTAVLLEAGEKAVDPPMAAKGDVVRGDVSIFAGGITWVDPEYDERMGPAVRALTDNRMSGLPLGFEMAEKVQALLKEAFFLNKLSLPPPEGEMTAYEISQRVSEYIRQALPLFEPLENDYNGVLCERTFDVMLRHGGLGPLVEIPPSLAGAEVKFKFQTPLQAAMDSEKAALFQQTQALLAQAVQMDQTVVNDVDVRAAFRDALAGIGAPSKWMRDEKDADALAAAHQKALSNQALLTGAESAGRIAKDFSAANANLVKAPAAV